MVRLQTILHPTDFSRSAMLACHLAVSLARDHEAQLLVTHVVPMLPVEAARHQPTGNLESDVWNHFEQLKSEVPGLAATRHQLRLIEGDDPATEIIRFAAETVTDMIVMGTHGRSGFNKLMMGSVAERVSRDAACPVVTVRVAGLHDSP